MEKLEEFIAQKFQEIFLEEFKGHNEAKIQHEAMKLVQENGVSDALENLILSAADEIRQALSPQPPTPRYASLFQFVDEFIVVMYGVTQSKVERVNWAPKWWSHPEAVARLSALWHRYEQVRFMEPATGLETFLRSFGDYHIAQLMIDDGVFSQCRKDDWPTVPLRTEPAAYSKGANQ